MRKTWVSALERSGANPQSGRQLPALFGAEGLAVETFMLDRVTPPDPVRLEFLRELKVTDNESQPVDRLESILQNGDQLASVHLPYWIVLATNPPHHCRLNNALRNSSSNVSLAASAFLKCSWPST